MMAEDWTDVLSHLESEGQEGQRKGAERRMQNRNGLRKATQRKGKQSLKRDKGTGTEA